MVRVVAMMEERQDVSSGGGVYNSKGGGKDGSGCTGFSGNSMRVW